GGGGGGGGGGYYGGRASWMSAGAGGSSFISGLVGANAIDAGGAHTGQPNHYSGKVFSNAVTTAGANGAGAAGRGQIAIAPIIAGVSPSEGTTAGGTTLTITGTYFTNASAVKVGAQNCTSYTVVNDTTITCVTPAASNGRVGVSVTGPSGMMRTLDNVFTYRTPLTITAVSPNHGLTMGGESVTITGTGFASPGGISAGTPSAPVLAGATTMVNQTGTGATAHSFTIEPRYVYKFELWGGAGGGVGSWGGADGRGGYATGWYDARGSAANETAYAYAGQAGGLDWAGVGGQGGVRGGDGGNNWMDYTGGGGGSSEVRIGGTGLANRVIVAGGGGGKGSLAGGGTASGGNGDGFPAYPGGAGGVRGDGSGGSGVANNSTYEGSGGGGAGYLGGEGGLWGSTGGGGGGAGTSYIGGVVSLDSSNTAWFSTPGQAGTYGTAGNGRALVTRYKMMSVSEINLNIGILAGGNTITISGSGLGGVNAITVGGQNCTSLTVVNDTSVTCVVPSGASAGAVDVRVVDAGGGVVTVTNGYTYYLPVVTFDAGGTPAVCTNVVVVSDTQITCTTGAHAAGIVAVAVAIGSDTASLANAYEYLVPTYITLEWDDSEDSLEISGAASSGGTVLSESTTVIVSTNNAAGYLLKLSMNTSEQRLVCTTGAGANHYLGPATSASLGLNEWGYSLNSGSSWAAVPALASPVTVANTNAANESGDSTAVLFSGKLNNSTPACRYGGMVKWTASVK
ncbi:IPT/TIG domain-containing protein, partial [Candidatus Saccharibacteria bacterium]|nr:IPT/TIG domain-containing protein [Candidatus Saccharibacteria bacterium]